MQENPSKYVEAFAGKYPGQDTPECLKENMARHQHHLSTLATSLIAKGCNEETIVRSLEVAFQSYQAELLDSIMALREGADES
ncbi:hypothetical protein [Hwanghaeella sp.]|uniref:hypothetical protein n=1 Tax=Hwanghaeella sp. TaxID=2605943 RepID=UPI0013C169F4|nr:hypothetical protein [Cyanothece sp. SIO1E1]